MNWSARESRGNIHVAPDYVDGPNGQSFLSYSATEIAMTLNRKDALLREALEALYSLAPRVKDYGGCFGRMTGGGGADCECTACKIKRELNTNTTESALTHKAAWAAGARANEQKRYPD